MFVGALWLWGGCSSEPVTPPGVKDDLPDSELPAVLVRQDEASREACAHGGARVRSGLDANGDGVLDDAEVQHTTVICHPAPPEQEELDARVRLEPIPAGEACAEGGTAVLSGLDANHNGTLDDAEVQQRDVICRERLLTRLSPAGGACPGQGVAIDFGRDLDADGALSQGEIVATQVECSDVLSGTFTVRTAQELAALAPIRVIIGSLRFTALPLETVSLPGLEVITGDLTLTDHRMMKSFSLPALVSVGGFLRMSYNALLAQVDFAKLQRVEQELMLYDNPLLETVAGWPELDSVGALSLGHNSSLVDLRGFTKLRAVRGNVLVYSNDALADFSLHLTRVGAVMVRSNPSLRTMSLKVPDDSGSSSLSFVGGALVEGNPALTTLELGFPTVTGNIQILHDAALQEVTVTSWQLEGSLIIEDDSALARVIAPNLNVVSGSLRLARSPIEQLDFGPSPLSVRGELRVANTKLTAFSATQHVSDVGGDASFSGNSLMTSLALSRLHGGLSVSSNDALTDLSLVNTDVLEGSLGVEGNSRLESLEGVRSRDIRGDLYIQAGSRMTRLSLPELRWVRDSVYLLGTDLVDVGLDALEFVGQDVRVGYTAMSRWKGLGALRQVAGNFLVFNHPSLQEVSLPRLQSSAVLNIYGNPVLTRLSLPLFTSATSVTISDNAALPVCEVDRFFSQLPPGLGSQEGNDAAGVCSSP
ncbi:hypothetical protein BON30_07645 [Cystobacter ferrugineus]|uniref:DUF7151 domain-containing protein n=1 Tax=Cystobacter ferrugineus TaxID=83449 RepID=A0A1L9BEY2_9BACT|nr:hypothetical protein BON30_07645 [Cystobacter ferrugineus]